MTEHWDELLRRSGAGWLLWIALMMLRGIAQRQALPAVPAVLDSQASDHGFRNLRRQDCWHWNGVKSSRKPRHIGREVDIGWVMLALGAASFEETDCKSHLSVKREPAATPRRKAGNHLRRMARAGHHWLADDIVDMRQRQVAGVFGFAAASRNLAAVSLRTTVSSIAAGWRRDLWLRPAEQ